MWPPRIIAKESADEKNDGARESTVTVSLPALMRSASTSASVGIRPHAEDAVLGLEDDLHAPRG